MASFTVTSNARQDAGIARTLARVNAERAAQRPPLGALTADQYVLATVRAAFDSWTAQSDDEDATTVHLGYTAATPAQRNAARAALGLP
jgi:hypothetical protein